MRQPTSHHAALPYAIFFYAASVLVLSGILGVFVSGPWALILTELLLLGATFLARLFISQAIIDVHLPSLIPLRRTPESSFLSRCSPRNTGFSLKGFLVFLAAIPVLTLFTNLMVGLLALLPPFQERAAQYAANNADLLTFGYSNIFFLGVFAVVVAAPVAEEVLFRGTILPLLRLGHPDAPVTALLLIDGILFSLIHMNSLTFIPLTVVGLFLADVGVRSRSIVMPIMAHALYNLCSGIFLPLVLSEMQLEFAVVADFFKPEPSSFQWIDLIPLVLSGCVCLLLWRLFRKHTPIDSFYESPKCALAQ